MLLQFSEVFVKQKNIHQSQKLLTEYLELSMTDDLWKWISDSTFISIIDLFLIENKMCFNLTNSKCKREKTVIVKTVMITYKDSVIISVIALSLMNKILTDKKRSFQCYFFIIYCVIERFSNIFKNSVDLTYSVSEDIYWCVYLLKYMIKSQINNRKDKNVHQDELIIISDYYNSKNEISSLNFFNHEQEH